MLAAPAAADKLGHRDVLTSALVALIVFCLLSSAVYLINDVRDAAEDRRHPVKCNRPIASGALGASEATVAAFGCLVLALVSAWAVRPALAGVVFTYAVLNYAYTTWLRRVAIADIAAVAGCFVLRAVAGGVATGVALSHWFVLVVSFAALFVAAGKRYADIIDPAARGSRGVLRQYDPDFLRLVIGIACAVALGAYALWAFQGGHADIVLARQLTLVPFMLALLRYALLLSAGEGGAPEAVIFRDRFMQLAGLSWVVLFMVGA